MSYIIELTPHPDCRTRFHLNLIRPKRASQVYVSGRIDIDVEYELVDQLEDLAPHQISAAILAFETDYDIGEYHRSPVSKALPWPVS